MKTGVQFLHVPFKGNAIPPRRSSAAIIMAQSDSSSWGASSTRDSSGCSSRSGASRSIRAAPSAGSASRTSRSPRSIGTTGPVELLEHLQVPRIFERLPEAVVQDLDDPRLQAARADDT